MFTPILATKLYIPPPRPTGIHRSHLVARLHEGLHRKVTLISAPAGFGKTTVASEWVAVLQESSVGAEQWQVAWLSLDEGDSDPLRFLRYLVAALRTVVPTLGEGVLSSLQSAPSLSSEAVLAALLNEIAAISNKIVLVLDDYHLLVGNEVGDALNFLIEHLPTQMHLVIVTREDPRLPLARLRVRDQLTELRGADLRFRPAEAAGFLQAMGLALSPADVDALEKRTEGWIAGLQLAALSMQGQHDASGFIQAFAGDHRYIVDYLVEEVLQRQPAAVRSFLLQTAILDELSGPLCDAVTAQAGGKEQLAALERSNFFVVPLDNRRHWYRYHHLFADVLRVHLMAELPDLPPLLHQRASAWYEQQGATEQAIRHAFAATDFARVAHLAEQAIPMLRKNRAGLTLLGWLKVLPTELIERRPVLCCGFAWGLMANGELEAIEPWLRCAEGWFESKSALPHVSYEDAQTEMHEPRHAEMLYVDVVELRRVPMVVGLYRAARSQILGNVVDTVKYALQVLDIAPDDDPLGRGSATALLGLAYWTSGELERAYQTYTEGMAWVEVAGNISDVITSTLARASIRIAQGRLHEARRIYAQALQTATKTGETILLGTADLYVGMSELDCERNELDAALQQLSRSRELSERTGLPQDLYRWSVAMARMRRAQGDLDGALDLLQEAEHLERREFFPNVRPIAALKARLWIEQGRLGAALGWARGQSLAADDDLAYLREFEHLTLARLLLARYHHDRSEQELLEATSLLERLWQAAYAGGRMGSLLEILLLQARVHQARGDIANALMSLQSALTLAEPEGYVRIFVDEGPMMAALLREAVARQIVPTYATLLLTAFGVESPSSTPEIPHPVTIPPSDSLIEPLSERELDVLRLFATELSGPEIAAHLVIALSTVRTHTKGIYSKLGVNSRREAVKRAEALHLL